MKSKMRSDASSKSEQPEKPVVFLDRCLGNTVIADVLRRNKNVVVEIHDNHFPIYIKDEELLSVIGKRMWLFLTKDKRIRYSYAAQLVIKKAKVKMFYLSTRGDLLGIEMAEIFSKALPHIINFSSRNKPPFIAKITRDGKVSSPIFLK